MVAHVPKTKHIVIKNNPRLNLARNKLPAIIHINKHTTAASVNNAKAINTVFTIISFITKTLLHQLYVTYLPHNKAYDTIQASLVLLY